MLAGNKFFFSYFQRRNVIIFPFTLRISCICWNVSIGLFVNFFLPEYQAAFSHIRRNNLKCRLRFFPSTATISPSLPTNFFIKFIIMVATFFRPPNRENIISQSSLIRRITAHITIVTHLIIYILRNIYNVDLLFPKNIFAFISHLFWSVTFLSKIFMKRQCNLLKIFCQYFGNLL